MPSGRFAKDLTGLRFGKLVVAGRLPNTANGMARWDCLCDCGRSSRPITASLTSMGVISCGCHRLTIIGKIKICARCGERKLHKEFYPTNGKTKGVGLLAANCKVCAKIIAAEKYISNPIPSRDRARIASRAERLATLNAYGHACVCCGESEERFLAIDHTNGGGGRHRKELGFSGARFYRWLRENGYPPEYQVLCTNCNWGKHVNGGYCPHVTGNLVAALSFGG